MIKVHWTRTATEDLDGIFQYICKDSEYYALNIIENIFSAIENLVVFPKLGRSVPEVHDLTIREIIVQNYRIIYQINYDNLTLLTIVHVKQNLISSLVSEK